MNNGKKKQDQRTRKRFNLYGGDSGGCSKPATREEGKGKGKRPSDKEKEKKKGQCGMWDVDVK